MDTIGDLLDEDTDDVAVPKNYKCTHWDMPEPVSSPPFAKRGGPAAGRECYRTHRLEHRRRAAKGYIPILICQQTQTYFLAIWHINMEENKDARHWRSNGRWTLKTFRTGQTESSRTRHLPPRRLCSSVNNVSGKDPLRTATLRCRHPAAVCVAITDHSDEGNESIAAYKSLTASNTHTATNLVSMAGSGLEKPLNLHSD